MERESLGYSVFASFLDQRFLYDFYIIFVVVLTSICFKSFFAYKLFPSSLFLCSSCLSFRASIGQYCIILCSLTLSHLFSSLSHQYGFRFLFHFAILKTPTSVSTGLPEGFCCLINWSHSLFVLNYSLTMGASDVSI